MENPDLIDRLELDIYSGLIINMHFGVTCRSWGPASWFQPLRSRSTRTKENPLGSMQRPTEIEGNLQAENVARLCRALIKVSGYFSIENPGGSMLFHHPHIKALASSTNSIFVRLDQCMYGLTLPGSLPGEFCRKRTCIFTNMLELKDLEITCSGQTKLHRHVHAWGSRKINGKSVCMTSAAAAYPPKLCKAWALRCRLCLESLA